MKLTGRRASAIRQHARDGQQHQPFVIVGPAPEPDCGADEARKEQHLDQVEARDHDLAAANALCARTSRAAACSVVTEPRSTTSAAHTVPNTPRRRCHGPGEPRSRPTGRRAGPPIPS